eukprot:301498_1
MSDSLFQMIVFALLFYQCAINASQDDLRLLTFAQSFDTNQTVVMSVGRFVLFGNNFFCKLHSGYHTMPRSLNQGLEFATRSLQKTYMLKATRKDSQRYTEQMMFGPCDYFETLYNGHTHMYTIQIDANGTPKYISHPKNASNTIQQLQHPKSQISVHEYTTIRYDWISGKKHPAVEHKKAEYKREGKPWPSTSLFVDPGVMELEQDIKLKQIDATNFDLSPFKARLTSNSHPFDLPSSGAFGDDYSVITYFYGKKYEQHVLRNDGIFLEHHPFVQSITPLHAGASGFVILAKKNGCNGSYGTCTMDLVAVQIPYGYTLIIDKGCIHGDANLKGLYMMAMTTNYFVMNLADSVFLKNANTKQNIHVTLENEKNVVMDIPYQLIPLVSLNNKDEKLIFSIIHNSVDHSKIFYTKVVFNPFSSLWWKYYQNNIIIAIIFVAVIVLICIILRRRNKLKDTIEKTTEKVIANNSKQTV